MNRAERRLRKIKRHFGREWCFLCMNEPTVELWDNTCKCSVIFKIENHSGVHSQEELIQDIPKGVVIIYEESR